MNYSHSDFDYIDSHVHFFPNKMFNAVWNFFEIPDHNGNPRGWPIKYKYKVEALVNILKSKNVHYFTSYNYAHKKEIAESLNEWNYSFSKNYQDVVPFGTLWPWDENVVEYIQKSFEQYNFKGIKIQPLVQEFHVFDEKLDKIYKLIIDKGKWLTVHIGTAPYRNKYVGFHNFIKLIEKYPNMKIIVPHMGAFEYQKFLILLDKYENLYLDTTMIFIPNNIFPERKSKQPSDEELLSYQDRILFGTDFPNIPYVYEKSTEGLLKKDFPKGFYKKIFFNNAKKIFDL